MKFNKLKEKLQSNRPMTMVSIRMPKDVVEDLKRVAPQVGFSGYQPLIRAYVGQGRVWSVAQRWRSCWRA